MIRVPRSWSAPHRVTFLKDMNFYVRNAAGKNPMSIDELRQTFNSSRDLGERLRTFRAERVEAIVTKDLPVTLRDGPKLALHVVPLSAVADPLDLQFQEGAAGIVPPLRNNSHSWQHTIEGLATYTMPEPSRSYSLMFRNGALEGVAELPLADGHLLLEAVDKLVLGGWKTFRAFANGFEVEPPVYVFATLIDVKGLAPRVDAFGGETPVPARKSVLILPETTVGVDRFAKSPVRTLQAVAQYRGECLRPFEVAELRR